MNAYLRIIRLNVCFLAVLGMIIGAVLSSVQILSLFIFAAIAVFLICAGGNVINDYFDIKIDKLNKPNRPLPSGEISLKNALLYYIILSALGLMFAYLVSGSFFMIAVFNFLLSALYAWKLKKIAILGNITDSFLAAVTFLSGALITGYFLDMLNSPVLVLAGIAFFTTMGREIYKDIEDIKGDKEAGAKTLPIVSGIDFSMNTAKIFVALGAISALLPYIKQVFGIYYIISIIPAITTLLYSTTIKEPEKAQKTVKIGMFLGIFAFLVGVFLS